MKKNTLLFMGSSCLLIDIIKKILERAGYEIYCANEIGQAKEELKKRAIDGIVLDCVERKEIESFGNLQKETAIPVMILSNDKEDELASLRAGASDYLKKPFDCEVLKARIEAMLQGKNVKEAGKIKKSAGMRRYAAAACIAMIFAGVWIKAALTGNLERVPDSIAETPIDEIPAKEELIDEGSLIGSLNMFLMPDENAKPYAETTAASPEKPNYLIPHYGGFAASAKTGKTETTLVNPAENTYGFTFEITLEETGENLYTSGLIEPGMCVENFKIAAPAEKGAYRATLTIRVYDTASQTEIADSQSDITITIV